MKTTVDLIMAVSAGLLVTVSAAWIIQSAEHRRVNEVFQLDASTRVQAVERQVVILRRDLQLFRQLIEEIPPESAEQFARLAEPYLDNALVIGWIVPVSGDQRDFPEGGLITDDERFKVRSDIAEDGELQAAQHRNLRYPLVYALSNEAGDLPIGLDLYSEQRRREAILRAIESSQVAVTKPLKLAIRDNGEAGGFGLFAPVLVSTADDGVEAGTGNGDGDGGPALRGLVVSSITFKRLLLETRGSGKQELLLTLHHGQDQNQGGDAVPVFQGSQAPASRLALAYTASLDVAGDLYTLRIEPSDLYLERRLGQPWIAAVLVGLTLTALVVFYIVRVKRQRLAALRLEASLTAAKERESLFSKLTALVPGMIYQIERHPDGSVFFPYVSEGVRAVYELSPAQVREDAQAVFSCLHPDDANEVLKSIVASAETMELWQQEYRVQLPGRGLCWHRGEAAPERLDNGGTLWHGYITDITRQKAIEEELHRLSITDQLTSLSNRRYLLRRIRAEMARLARYGQPVALIMLDLDHFKALNDHFGHAIGDAVLVYVSDILKQRTRETDVCARWGGEEFMLLLPATTMEEAVLLAESLRGTIDSGKAPVKRSVTASFGVVEIRLEDNEATVLQRIDALLYDAKAGGRNCVRAEKPR